MSILTGHLRRVSAIATVAVTGLAMFAGTPAVAGATTSPRPAAEQIGEPADLVASVVPIEEIVPGMTGTGLTVSRGRTPEPFSVTVLGVLPGAIGAGVDLIVFEAASPAIEAAGGIWGGMSGSPVYASDGRLIGAVSYGFGASPSKIAGMTPAVTMLELLSGTRAADTVRPAKAALPAELSRKLVQSGMATEAQVQIGLEPLRIPLAVSGLSAARIARLNAQLEQSGSPMRAYAGSAASGSPAPAGALFPGSNFVAAMAYGDVTMGAIGTTTAVFGNKALAFGHPMLFLGPVSLSAHQGTAIAVVKDATFGSFKLATVDGIAGTVQQDRLVGLRAQLGPGPRTTVPITATVRSGATSRTATTWATMDEFAADAAVQHLLGNIDRVFNRIAPGRATVTWTIRGTYGSNNVPWQLSRTNRYASTYDIAYDAVYELANQIYTIRENAFATVKLSGVTIDATITPDYGAYTIDGVLAYQNGAWIELTDGVLVTPGRPLDLQVRLRSYRGTTRLVNVRLDVPPGSVSNGGWLSVYCGSGQYNPPQASSFPELIVGLRDAPHNNDLITQLRISGETGDQTVRQVIMLDEPVSGDRGFPVAEG